MNNNTTKTLVINAMFIALTLVATMFINIRLPIMGNGGLIHLGNVPLFIAAFIFGKRTAFRMDCLGTIHICYCWSNGLDRRSDQ